LRGDVYLGGPPVVGPAADEIAWSFVKDTKDPDQLRRFATAYPKSPHLGEATTRTAVLESQTAEEPRKADEEGKKLTAVVPPVAPAAASATPAVVAPTFAPPVASGPCGGGAVTVSWSSRSAKPLSAAEECVLKPKDTFRECDKCPEMAVVPAGSFTMGSPEGEKDRRANQGPQRTVTIGKPFAVGKFHVTVDQFAAFVAEAGYEAGSKCLTLENSKVEERQGRSWRNPGFSQGGSHPAVCLNWNDAKAVALRRSIPPALAIFAQSAVGGLRQCG